MKMYKLILGTAQLGLDYGIINSDGKPTNQKSFELIKECLNNGIYQFDTAQAYGNAEKKLGEASIKLAPFMERGMRVINDGGYKNSSIDFDFGINFHLGRNK